MPIEAGEKKRRFKKKRMVSFTYHAPAALARPEPESSRAATPRPEDLRALSSPPRTRQVVSRLFAALNPPASSAPILSPCRRFFLSFSCSFLEFLSRSGFKYHLALKITIRRLRETRQRARGTATFFFFLFALCRKIFFSIFWMQFVILFYFIYTHHMPEDQLLFKNTLNVAIGKVRKEKDISFLKRILAGVAIHLENDYDFYKKSNY